MVFFQAVLLAGYAYSHATTAWLGPRKQAVSHLVVLVLPFLFFLVNGPLVVNPEWIAGREGNPIPALLLVLTLSVGVPMFVVCTSAPLLQRWFASTDHPAAQDPYFLYGASNLGSMLALVGYPAFVEPYFTLQGQRVDWAVGYVLLALMTAACAFLMWKSKHALEPVLVSAGGATAAGSPASPPFPEVRQTGAIKPAEKAVTRRTLTESPGRLGKKGESVIPPSSLTETEDQERERTKPVTWQRRLKWTILAFVPSSLMLGATTYITTDIAAIPLLWVLPLALYLLTFIIVFAHIAPRTQSIVTMVLLDLLVIGLVWWIAPIDERKPPLFSDESLLWLIRLVGVGLVAFSLQILKLNDSSLIHRVMIMVMPLLILLLLFITLSEVGVTVIGKIVLHLATLFVVSMVCHGELARDRPAPQHLTEYFLLMSIGGVIGGLFNALFAPLVFHAIIEYQLVLMVACLLLPPLGYSRENTWARRADIALAGVFLVVGVLLLVMRQRDGFPSLKPIVEGPWVWCVVAMLLGLGVGGLSAWQRWGSPPLEEGVPFENNWIDRLLDVVLPLALMILVLGLYWGLPSTAVQGRVRGFADMVRLDFQRFRFILTFGLPAVLCYTFVERSVRFGLGVGAILLAAALCNVITDSALFQTRSFFGVLRVEDGATRADDDGYYYWHNRLVHGTTLHGKQIREDQRPGEDGEAGPSPESDYYKQIPLSYYALTGPIGQVFRAYNTDPGRPTAVIGLGTGTMASYGLKGQTVDFYDIDPEVVGISYDSNVYFSFVEDAEERGANVGLILGDARLTFEPKKGKTQARLKPMHKRVGEIPGDRQYGDPLTPDFQYGLIVVDAFSSDAIPIHLITKRALEIYRDRMLPDGVLCMHISNRYLNLEPVLANIVEELGMAGVHMSDDDESSAGKNRSHWVAIARKKEHLKKILEPASWTQDSQRLSMLGASLWPAQATTGLATSSGLSYAFFGMANFNALEKEKTDGSTTAWKPLSTSQQLAADLEEANAELQRAEEELEKTKAETAEKAVKRARKERDRLVEKTAANRRVGVWTDDYSNLLSVFSW